MTSNFGKVSQEEVEMKSYEPFPDAEAVVLFETCEIITSFRKIQRTNTISYRLVTTEKIHRRIKIFNKTAFERGNISISYIAENYLSGEKSGHSVNKIKARTYILEEGNIVEYKVDKKDIFDKVSVDRKTND